MMKTIILRLVHCLIALGQFLHRLVLLLPPQALNFTKPALTPMSIQTDSKTLKKQPSHLGFIITEEQFSYQDLANMIVWSITLGISYISIYDFNGEVKRNSLILQSHLQESKHEVFRHDKLSYDIQLFSSSHPLEQESSGLSKAQSYHVHLLCVEDGQRSIVATAQYLSRMVSDGSFSLQDIQPSSVDKLLHESCQFPDPEVCLKFGPVDSLLGYLPWQIRLTEIISVPSHHGISYKSFLSSLVEYGNTSQRFGK